MFSKIRSRWYNDDDDEDDDDGGDDDEDDAFSGDIGWKKLFGSSSLTYFIVFKFK